MHAWKERVSGLQLMDHVVAKLFFDRALLVAAFLKCSECVGKRLAHRVGPIRKLSLVGDAALFDGETVHVSNDAGPTLK